MDWVIEQVFTLIGLGVLLLLVAAVAAPLESLGWWAGWTGKAPSLDEVAEGEFDETETIEAPPPKYLASGRFCRPPLRPFTPWAWLMRLRVVWPGTGIGWAAINPYF